MSIISSLLKCTALRRSLIVHLKSEYFHEIGHSIPLKKNYWANLLEIDAYDSFSEIFIQQEYEHYLPDESFSKVIDLGAHYGYFSLWLQTKSLKGNLHSLLVEPSPKCCRSLKSLVEQPLLKEKFTYLQAAVSDQRKEWTEFYDRPFMAGSSFSFSANVPSVKVKVLQEDQIQELLSPPYDLVKCDIEGSEWDLIRHYSKTLKQSKYLLLEWHSWHPGNGGYDQLAEELKALGFVISKSSSPIPSVGREGVVGLVLAHNQCFQN